MMPRDEMADFIADQYPGLKRGHYLEIARRADGDIGSALRQAENALNVKRIVRERNAKPVEIEPSQGISLEELLRECRRQKDMTPVKDPSIYWEDL